MNDVMFSFYDIEMRLPFVFLVLFRQNIHLVKKILPKLIHLHHQTELLIQQRMDLCFRVLYPIF